MMGYNTQTPLYARRTLVIPASTPKPEDISARKHLTAPLKLSVHEYNMLGSHDDSITIFLTHGTSFNKHFWVLIIEYLLAQQPLQYKIKKIVAIDAANHGDSAVLNQGRLPSNACWPDDSRDILHVLKYLEIKAPVLGIGHSFGGGSMCHAHMMEPTAFLSTVFIEPILFQMKEQTEGVARMALGRRDKWDSLDAVVAAFGQSRSLQNWDKRQLRVYIEHGTHSLGEDSPSSVRVLKTPKEQEAATYLAAPHPQILDLLSRSNGSHHFIWGSKSKVISRADRESVDQIIQPPSTSQMILGAEHLIPMTHPETLAKALGNLILDGVVFSPQVKL